jgi:hypothetical protein
MPGAEPGPVTSYIACIQYEFSLKRRENRCNRTKGYVACIAYDMASNKQTK